MHNVARSDSRLQFFVVRGVIVVTILTVAVVVAVFVRLALVTRRPGLWARAALPVDSSCERLPMSSEVQRSRSRR